MLPITSYLLIFFCIPLCAKIDTTSYIVYSPEEMAEHKKKCMESMRSNSANIKDATYQMQRALLTVSGRDTDYIPKVVGAGEMYTDGPIPYQLMHNGVKIILNSYYDVQWMTDVIYGLKGHHEPQEEKCFYEVLKYIPDNAIMLELGSFWGYYSLWFAFEVDGANNYLIEPDLHRLEIGIKNFELNNKTGNFFRGYVGAITDPEPNFTGAQKISIDDFIDQEKIERIHILHADIQRAEFEMLKTIVKNLDKIDYFFISTHDIRVHTNCLNFLKSHEYTIIAAHTDTESYSADGLIVAKRKSVAGPEQIEIQKH
jgi:hypothetical protein